MYSLYSIEQSQIKIVVNRWEYAGCLVQTNEGLEGCTKVIFLIHFESLYAYENSFGNFWGGNEAESQQK